MAKMGKNFRKQDKLENKKQENIYKANTEQQNISQYMYFVSTNSNIKNGNHAMTIDTKTIKKMLYNKNKINNNNISIIINYKHF